VRAREFFEQVNALALEFTGLSRDGDREFAFLGAVFPTNRRVAPAVTPPASLVPSDESGEAGAA
jgi:hypothetical protein